MDSLDEGMRLENVRREDESGGTYTDKRAKRGWVVSYCFVRLGLEYRISKL